MDNTWSLRSEIFSAAHRWPLPLLAFLLGSLIGWAVAGFVPTPYRAETSLNVTISDDLVVRNPDDFKNSQMGELNMFILSRDVLGETLNRLRNRDGYWNQVSVRDLEGKLNTYWRNTGRWRLVAEDDDPQRAVQLAEAWGRASMDKLAVALFQASRLLDLQTRYAIQSRAKTDLDLRALELEQVQSALVEWQAGTSAAPDDPLPPLEHNRLADLAARAVRLDPAGLALIDQIPAQPSVPEAYRPWTEEVIAYIQTQREIIGGQQISQQLETNRTFQELNDTIKATHGLTALMQIEPVSEDDIGAQPVRWRTDTALVGGLVGLIAWVLITLGWSFLKAKK